MESKKVILAINPELYKLIKARAERDYMNVQQYIYDLLRKNALALEAKKSAPRKPKSSGDLYMDIMTRRR